MKVVCEKIYINGKVGWKISTENIKDFVKLEEVVKRVLEKHYDDYVGGISDLQMNVKLYEDERYIIIYKNTRFFDLRGDEKDVSVSELEKFIELLRESKNEIDTKETRVYEI